MASRQHRTWLDTRRLIGGLLCCALTLAMLGCDGDRVDASALYKGMDRSAIIAHLGAPDERKRHDHMERLTYKDGEHYEYLLLLKDGKLSTWHHERIYKTNRFSQVRGGLDASP